MIVQVKIDRYQGIKQGLLVAAYLYLPVVQKELAMLPNRCEQIEDSIALTDTLTRQEQRKCHGKFRIVHALSELTRQGGLLIGEGAACRRNYRNR